MGMDNENDTFQKEGYGIGVEGSYVRDVVEGHEAKRRVVSLADNWQRDWV